MTKKLTQVKLKVKRAWVKMNPKNSDEEFEEYWKILNSLTEVRGK